MTLRDDDLRAIWREGGTPPPSNRSACLTEEQWARLLSKEADSEERSRVADHIASCTDCADEYRLLLPLQTWADDVQQAVSRAEPPRVSRWFAWFSLPRPALALVAAGVLLVMLAAPFYLLLDARRQNIQLRQQLAENQELVSSTQDSLVGLQEELRRQSASQRTELNALQQQLSTPQLGVAIADLEPSGGSEVRGIAAPQDVKIDRADSLIMLILNFAPLKSRSILEVEITGVNGSARWVGRAERDTSTASLTLALPASGYPPGRYEVRLFDVTDLRTTLAEYRVTIGTLPAKDR